MEQFKSAFEYYGQVQGSFLNEVRKENVSNPLSLYLNNPAKYERNAKLTYVRNKQVSKPLL